jgi:hypothetical protein
MFPATFSKLTDGKAVFSPKLDTTILENTVCVILNVDTANVDTKVLFDNTLETEMEETCAKLLERLDKKSEDSDNELAVIVENRVEFAERLLVNTDDVSNEETFNTLVRILDILMVDI